MKPAFLALLALWILLNAADLATTIALLHHTIGQESNPLALALLARGGLAALAWLKLGITAAGMGVAMFARWGWQMPRVSTLALLVGDALLAIAVANNAVHLLHA